MNRAPDDPDDPEFLDEEGEEEEVEKSEPLSKGVKAKKCPDCNFTTVARNGIFDHMKDFHKRRSSQSNSCPHCSAKFDRYYLLKHIDKVHAVPEEEAKAKSPAKVVAKGREEESRLRPILPKSPPVMNPVKGPVVAKDVAPEDSSHFIKIASVQSINPNQNLLNIAQRRFPIASGSPPNTKSVPDKGSLKTSDFFVKHGAMQGTSDFFTKPTQEGNLGSNRGGPFISSVVGRGGTLLPSQRAPVPSRDYSRVPGPIVSPPPRAAPPMPCASPTAAAACEA